MKSDKALLVYIVRVVSFMSILFISVLVLSSCSIGERALSKPTITLKLLSSSVGNKDLYTDR